MYEMTGPHVFVVLPHRPWDPSACPTTDRTRFADPRRSPLRRSNRLARPCARSENRTPYPTSDRVALPIRRPTCLPGRVTAPAVSIRRPSSFCDRVDRAAPRVRGLTSFHDRVTAPLCRSEDQTSFRDQVSPPSAIRRPPAWSTSVRPPNRSEERPARSDLPPAWSTYRSPSVSRRIRLSKSPSTQVLRAAM
jgi:hypothetical protein